MFRDMRGFVDVCFAQDMNFPAILWLGVFFEAAAMVRALRSSLDSTEVTGDSFPKDRIKIGSKQIGIIRH